MSTGKKYDKPEAGEWIKPVQKKYQLACCDCGLVHTLNFRVRKKKIQFQAFRNNRSTAMMRRSMWGKDWLKREKARRAKL